MVCLVVIVLIDVRLMGFVVFCFLILRVDLVAFVVSITTGLAQELVVWDLA